MSRSFELLYCRGMNFYSFYLMHLGFSYNSVNKLITSNLNETQNIPFEIFLAVTNIMECMNCNFLETSEHLRGIILPL